MLRANAVASAAWHIWHVRGRLDRCTRLSGLVLGSTSRCASAGTNVVGSPPWHHSQPMPCRPCADRFHSSRCSGAGTLARFAK